MSLGFGNMGAGGRRRSAAMQPFSTDYEIVDDRVVFGGHEQREKKRRLSLEQVKYLERSFETESKLEPERKMQLAFELGLSPRQVAVWYQNRRARWKAKQLEKDHDLLRERCNGLLLETQKLQSEVMRLTRELEEAKGTDQLKELEHVSKSSFEETDELSHAKNCSSSCTDAASKLNFSATTTTDCLGEEEEDEKVKTRILQDNVSKSRKQTDSAEIDDSEEFYDYLMVIDDDHQGTDFVYNLF